MLAVRVSPTICCFLTFPGNAWIAEAKAVFFDLEDVIVSENGAGNSKDTYEVGDQMMV